MGPNKRKSLINVFAFATFKFLFLICLTFIKINERNNKILQKKRNEHTGR